MSDTRYAVSNLKMKNFLDGAVAIYAVYKTVQQLPGFIDNLSQTQRKILYVLSDKPNKKIKTAETYTMIYNNTKYRHGDVSVYTTTENLANNYGNGISLLQPEGTFGYRTVRKASSPRYTSVIFGKAAQAIFSKKDFPLMEEQYTEGKKIEPYNMLPIVPLALINGANGIGLGFSCNINPRNPLYIINIIIDILSGKRKHIPPRLKPDFPFFNGDIELGEGLNQYLVKGVFVKKPRNVIDITELPISFNREKYIKLLNNLKDTKKIKSFKEECKKNSFYFSIKLEPEIYNKPDEYLNKLFKLFENISDSLTFLNRVDDEYEIITFESASAFLKNWIVERFKLYDKRKEFEIAIAKNSLLLLHEKIRFINAILDNKIIINRKSKAEIIKQLEKNGFKPMSNDWNELESGKSYKYLLNMPIYNLSSEQILDLEKEKNKIENDIKKTQDIPTAESWLSELKELKKLISKEQKLKQL